MTGRKKDQDFLEDESVTSSEKIATREEKVHTHVEQAKMAFDELEFSSELDFEEGSEESDAEEFLAMDDSEQEYQEDPSFIEDDADSMDLSGTELEGFESAAIEDEIFVSEEELQSIIESILFATDKPQSLAVIKQAFKGTNIKSKDIRRSIENLMIEYAGSTRGVTLEEVNGGYQLRTKVDNMDFLRGMVKARPFKVSGPALEVLSIVAYKQPCIKHLVDEIRGVESGHLLRGLMDRSLITFAGKSDLPGKPMLYSTTKKFLEIFGLRNLQELPSLSEIDELIPEGIGEEEEKETLDMVTESMSEQVTDSYSQNEEELEKISITLSTIDTSSEFFEDEKRRVRAKRDAERAQDIREALTVGEDVPSKDIKWLERYDAAILEEQEIAQAKASESAGDTDQPISEEELDGLLRDGSIEDSEGQMITAEDIRMSTTENETDSDVTEELLASKASTEVQSVGVEGEMDHLGSDELEPPRDLEI